MADPKDLYSSRVIAFVPQSEGFQTAIRVRLKKVYNTDPMDPDSAACPPRSESLLDLSTLNGQVRWVGVPRSLPETSDSIVPDGNRFVGAELQCCPRFMDWPKVLAEMGHEVLHLYDPAIVPCSEYEIQIISSTCLDLDDEGCYSQPLVVRTGKWGDVVDPLGGEDQPNFTDIGSVVDKFKGLFPPLKVQAMLRGNLLPLDGLVNFTDIGKVVEAFRTIPYMEAGPSPCPSCL